MSAVNSDLGKKCIYQLFYKESSSMDRGSLYQLRNLINRRDVTGAQDVVQKFRPHQQFVEDVTDAYIVAAFLDLMDMDDMTSTVSHPQHIPLNLMSSEQQVEFVNTMSKRVLKSFDLDDIASIHRLRDDLEALNLDDRQLEAMKVDDHYVCAICGKTYTALNWFKKHLTKKHHWNFYNVNNDVEANNAVKHFLFMSLLFRDTCDSYRMADGERAMRNAYFEWLYDHALKHYKYKIWLWRMLSYSMSILGFRESFEYKWNMSVNLKGGISNNIPNHNAVEIQVHNIKRELNTQGANKSYESAKQICMTTQVVDSIKQNLLRTTRTARARRDRPPADKSVDIKNMVQYLRRQCVVKDLCWNSFSSFRDPLDCVDGEELHSWINDQKRMAHLFM